MNFCSAKSDLSSLNQSMITIHRYWTQKHASSDKYVDHKWPWILSLCSFFYFLLSCFAFVVSYILIYDIWVQCFTPTNSKKFYFLHFDRHYYFCIICSQAYFGPWFSNTQLESIQMSGHPACLSLWLCFFIPMWAVLPMVAIEDWLLVEIARIFWYKKYGMKFQFES